MELNLIVNRGLNKEYIYKNPSPETIDLIIGEIIPVEFHFAILQKAEKPVNDYWYIQTAMRFWGNDDVLVYDVEVHFLTEKSFLHYRKDFTDINAVKKMFRLFALGISPEITGWIDKTDYVKNMPSEKKQWARHKKRLKSEAKRQEKNKRKIKKRKEKMNK